MGLIDATEHLIDSFGSLFGKSARDKYENHKKVFSLIKIKFDTYSKDNISISSIFNENYPILRAKIIIKNESTNRELEINSLPEGIFFTINISGHGKFFGGSSKKYEISFNYNLPDNFIDCIINYLETGNIDAIKKLNPKKIRDSR
jgi:hypothetical protein